MIKPYLYGGIVLLIVGLFSFSFYSWNRIDSLKADLANASTAIETLELRVHDLKEAEQRKAGALDAYMAIDSSINKFTNTALGIIKGYTKRDTPNEKCLDMSPPPELLRLHSSDSNKGSASTSK